MCSSVTARNIPIYSTAPHLWQADNVAIHRLKKKSGRKTLHYCNSVVLLVCSHEHDMWKNRVNWRAPRSYHTTLRTWMGHFVAPAARLWIYGTIITFYLNKAPQILPMSSVIFLRLCIVTHHEGQMFFYIPFLVTSIPSDSYSGKGKGSSCGGSLFSMFVASHSLCIGWFPV